RSCGRGLRYGWSAQRVLSRSLTGSLGRVEDRVEEEVHLSIGVGLHVEDGVDEVVDRAVAVRERRLDAPQVEYSVHTLQLHVLTLLDVHEQAEVQPVALVRALVVEQVLLTTGHPLVAVGGPVLVPAPVPAAVDARSAPPLLDAEVPVGMADALLRLPVLPALHELPAQGVHVAHAGHVPVLAVLDVEVEAEGADVLLADADPVLCRG